MFIFFPQTFCVLLFLMASSNSDGTWDLDPEVALPACQPVTCAESPAIATQTVQQVSERTEISGFFFFGCRTCQLADTG